jgi:ecotin
MKHRLQKAVGRALFDMNGPVLVISTRKACPSEARAFLPLPRQAALSGPLQRLADRGGSAGPSGSALRLWKAETLQQPGVQL